jgi:hypothetical protein
MSPSRRADLAKHFLSVANVPSGSVLLTAPQFVHFPLQAGNILCTVPKADVEEQMHFQFDVAFDEPGIFQGESLLVTIHNLRHLVRDIVMSFTNDGLLQ